jgi:triosephosphate isomerase (TIM)
MKKLVVGNMKMNLMSAIERERYLMMLKKALDGKNFDRTEIVLCPPSVHLENFHEKLGKKIKVGAQNIFWEREGSFTGEISPSMVKNLGCEYVILGHSERRRYFGEKDEEISMKISAALKVGLRPILCVGDKEQKADSAAVFLGQLKNCLMDVNGLKIENVIICYEPVWAISSNNPDHMPTANEIMSARILIKKFLVEKYGIKTSEKVKIIYGGSVDARNVSEVCIDPGMDGALVGRESLTPYEFIKIAEIING